MKRYRVKRGLASVYSTPPPIGTVFEVVRVREDGRAELRGDLQGATLLLTAPAQVLRDYFEEVDS